MQDSGHHNDDVRTGGHPRRLPELADDDAEAGDLLDELIDVLRKQLAPATITVTRDGSVSRIPSQAAVAPEFRRQAVTAFEAVGRHLANHPAMGEQVFDIEFSAALATGTLQCEIRPGGPSRGLADLVAREPLQTILWEAGRALLEWGPGQVLHLAVYPQQHAVR
jgi:hypothetical protein